MRRLAPVLLPIVVTIAFLIVATLFPSARLFLLIFTTGALSVTTVIVALFSKNTAIAQNLVATLVWSLVLFELLSLWGRAYQ